MKRRIALVFVGIAAVILTLGVREARQPVMVTRFAVKVPAMGCGSRPLEVIVIGDIHLSSGLTPSDRVTAMVAAVNRLEPDLVLLVGDYLEDGFSRDTASVIGALAPLGALKPRIASVAVLGNNDWDRGPGPVVHALQAVDVHVLENDAFITPEVAVMGLAELTSNTANPPLVEERYDSRLALTKKLPPPLTIWLTHNPVMFDRVATTGDMMFAGHTHGGQILPVLTLPVLRTLADAMAGSGLRRGWSADRYVGGYYRDGEKRMIVTTGVGTSTLPVRLGVPPEVVAVRFSGC